MSKITSITFNKINTTEVKKSAATFFIAIGALFFVLGLLALLHAGPFAVVSTTGGGLLIGIGASIVLGGIIGLYFIYRNVSKTSLTDKEILEVCAKKQNGRHCSSIEYNRKTGTFFGYFPRRNGPPIAAYSTKEMSDFEPIPQNGLVTSQGERISYPWGRKDKVFIGNLLNER